MTKARYNLKKQPLQKRAKFTVGVIKEAAAHILKAHGYHDFTTNRVAEKAGVSIGSLYQYFPSKESLIAEIKRDHFNELRELVKNAYERTKNDELSVIVGACVEASIDAHRIDPELHSVLSSDLSHFDIKEDDHSEDSIRTTIEHLLMAHRFQLRANLNIPLAAQLTYKVIEAMVHDTVLYNPQFLDDKDFVDEVTKMVMAYLLK